jgi:hypothetical protein
MVAEPEDVAHVQHAHQGDQVADRSGQTADERAARLTVSPTGQPQEDVDRFVDNSANQEGPEAKERHKRIADLPNAAATERQHSSEAGDRPDQDAVLAEMNAVEADNWIGTLIERAEQRDLRAEQRDRRAEQRDRMAEMRGSDDDAARLDRALAACDRELAAQDRDLAAGDRAELRDAYEQALGRQQKARPEKQAAHPGDTGDAERQADE